MAIIWAENLSASYEVNLRFLYLFRAYLDTLVVGKEGKVFILFFFVVIYLFSCWLMALISVILYRMFHCPQYLLSADLFGLVLLPDIHLVLRLVRKSFLDSDLIQLLKVLASEMPQSLLTLFAAERASNM